MEQSGRRKIWKDIVIMLLALALLALLVWLFLRPVEPAHRIVFGDLGRHTASSNAPPGGPLQPLPEPPANLAANGGLGATNFPLTNEPLHAFNDQSARRMEPPPTGQGSVPGDAGTNAAGTNPPGGSLSQNGLASPSSPSSNQTPMTASNSVASPSPTSPPPPARSSKAQRPRPRRTESLDSDNWPPDAANKDSTAQLLAEAKAAHMAPANPTPARTADLLANGAEPGRLFDPEAGSNVVFILDNSMNMLTNGKSLSARLDLERTLQSMHARQSFYVLLFHSGGYEGMPSLVPLPASPENIRAMTNWLFSVGHRAGADPTKAVQRALGLAPAPDTVWLLSGSPLTDKMVDNIREANASVNARINTVGLYTQDAEESLRRIAGENRGSYRFVPPPNAPPP